MVAEKPALSQQKSQRRAGVMLSYVVILINTVLAFAFTPFMNDAMGIDEYGVYQLIGSLVANLAILDLGLGDSVVRFVSRFHALKDEEGERVFLGTVTQIYGIIALLVGVVGVVLVALLPSMYGRTLTPAQLDSSKIMLIILLVSTAATVLTNTFSACIRAYEHFIVLRSIEITNIILTTVGSVAVLMMGMKSVAVVAVSAGVAILGMVIQVSYALWALKIRPKFTPLKWESIKEILGYSTAILVVVIVEQIYWKVNSTMLGAMALPAVVAVFSVGMTFSKHFMRFSTAITKVMMPKIVRRVEEGASPQELTDILISISRFQAIILLPLLGGLIVFGQEFIWLWMARKHPEYAGAYAVMLLTMVPYTIELIGSIRNQFMQAKNIYWQRSKVILVISLITIVTTYFGIKWFGMYGAAAATGLGLLVGYAWVSQILRKQMHLDMVRFGKELVSGLVPTVLVTALVGVGLNQILHGSWLALGIKSVIYAVVYGVILFFFGMTPTERAMLTSWRKRKAPAAPMDGATPAS